MSMNKNVLGVAVAAVLGTTAVPQTALADLLHFNYVGKFTMLDAGGAALANSSIPPKGNNQYQTSVSGTLTFDTNTMAGTGTLVPFNFFSNNPSLPAEAVGIEMGLIPGTNLVLGNMLFNWNGSNGIPVSIVMDASGMLSDVPAMYADYSVNGPGFVSSGHGAIPASDGTFVGAGVPGTGPGPLGGPGYLALGPNPIVTTGWNTTSLCTRGGAVNDGQCMGLSPSGGQPLILDTTANPNDYTPNNGGNIGGTPMIDGPFAGSNANFDITSLTLTNIEFTGGGSPVPVPAAVWLFGSGLLGLVAVARRRK